MEFVIYIIIDIVCYIGIGLMVTLLCTPTKTMTRKDRRQIFAIVVLFWPFVLVIAFFKLLKYTLQVWWR